MLRDAFDKAALRRLEQCFYLADHDERKARVRAVIALSAELERIRSVDIFSTGLGESLIEDVIEGEWRGVADLAEHFTFQSESQECRDRYAPLWAKFVDTARMETRMAEARLRGGQPD